MSSETKRLLELRIRMWFSAGELRLDAELISENADGSFSSELLAAGAVAWSPFKRPDVGFDADAKKWLALEDPEMKDQPLTDWELDPANFPDGRAMEAWGMFIASCLKKAAGAAILDQVIRDAAADPNRHVRLVFTALDHESSRLPVETLIWPTDTRVAVVATPDRRVSVIRTADALDRHTSVTPPTVGARDPGRYSAVVLRAGDDASFGSEFDDALRAFRSSNERSLKDFGEDSAGWAHADLLLLCAHGSASAGFQTRSGIVGDERFERGLSDAAAAVILAMCGSALPGASLNRPSLALRLARRGVPLIVGFQGKQTFVEPVVQPVVRRLGETLGPLLAVERADARVSLISWEDALIDARRDTSAQATPVVHVHPALLSGRVSELPDAARWARPRGERIGSVSLTATPWYVGGQVACVADGDGYLRMPLPVDVGARLQVDIGPGHANSLHHGDRLRLSLTTDDLEHVLNAWGIAGASLRVALIDPLASHDHEQSLATWARHSAELSAVVRAIAASGLVHPSPPRAVLRLLDSAVAGDWGAHDAAPRLVNANGSAVRRFARWPRVAIRLRGVRGDAHRATPVPEALRTHPPLSPPINGSLGVVAAALESGPAFAQMVTGQLAAVRKRREALPPNIRSAIQLDPTFVVLPSVAELIIGSGSDDGYVRHADLAEAAGRGAPEELVPHY